MCNRNLPIIADVRLMHRSDIDLTQSPKQRNIEQIWLFWHDEPCGVRGVQQELILVQFDWTISYGLSSYIEEQFEQRQGHVV